MAKVKEFGHLSLEQQSKLMQEINGLADISDGEEARRDAKNLTDFILLLREHGFITTATRVKYLHGIDEALEKRRKRQEAKT
jgi:hypothetical protein